jgi:hypothetical protein
MNPVSINSRKFLGEYVDTKNQELLPEGLLCSGLILFTILLIIYAIMAGMIALVMIVCVLVLGCGLGITLKRYRRDMVLSCVSDVVSLNPSGKQLMSKAA